MSTEMDTTSNDENQKKQLEFIFHYGSYALWKYLLKKFNLDLSEVYGKIPSEEPFITKDDIKFTIRIVDNNYDGKIDKKYFPDIGFFINAVNTVYNTFKLGLEHNGEKVLASYEFKMDSAYNLYLDDSDNYRLGVVII
jgi:hypothetical protein